MSYRKCQWCDKDIYSDLDWFTIVTVTGLAFYFCCGDCAFEWLQRIKNPRMEIERQILDFATYQKKAHETAQYAPLYIQTTSLEAKYQSGHEGFYELRYVYPVLGLSGE